MSCPPPDPTPLFSTRLVSLSLPFFPFPPGSGSLSGTILCMKFIPMTGLFMKCMESFAEDHIAVHPMYPDHTVRIGDMLELCVMVPRDRESHFRAVFGSKLCSCACPDLDLFLAMGAHFRSRAGQDLTQTSLYQHGQTVFSHLDWIFSKLQTRRGIMDDSMAINISEGLERAQSWFLSDPHANQSLYDTWIQSTRSSISKCISDTEDSVLRMTDACSHLHITGEYVDDSASGPSSLSALPSPPPGSSAPGSDQRVPRQTSSPAASNGDPENIDPENLDAENLDPDRVPHPVFPHTVSTVSRSTQTDQVRVRHVGLQVGAIVSFKPTVRDQESQTDSAPPGAGRELVRIKRMPTNHMVMFPYKWVMCPANACVLGSYDPNTDSGISKLSDPDVRLCETKHLAYSHPRCVHSPPQVCSPCSSGRPG